MVLLLCLGRSRGRRRRGGGGNEGRCGRLGGGASWASCRGGRSAGLLSARCARCGSRSGRGATVATNASHARKVASWADFVLIIQLREGRVPHRSRDEQSVRRHRPRREGAVPRRADRQGAEECQGFAPWLACVPVPGQRGGAKAGCHALLWSSMYPRPPTERLKRVRPHGRGKDDQGSVKRRRK